MRFCVCFCALVAISSGGVANAGMWSEFKDRCLTPFLAGEDPDISDLEPIPEPAIEGETIDLVQPPDGSFLLMSFNPGPYQDFSCGVTLPEGSNIDSDVAELASWIEAAVADGRFETTESADYAHMARSVDHGLGLFTLRAYLGRSGVGPSFTIDRR